MKSVKDLIPGAVGSNACVPAAAAPRKIDNATVEVVNRLFLELQAIFPAWRQAWPDDKALAAAKRSWIKGFAAAGINSLEQIRYGLEQCRLSGCDFAPSVGKFIQWCRPTPELLGLPSVEQAYRAACRIAHPAADRTRVHQAVYHAACETGFYELNSLPEEKSRRLFGRAYGITVQAILEGKPLREIPKALPERVSVRNPAAAQATLDAIRKMLKEVAHG